MSIKVLIVDDETLARSRLRTLLAECTSPRTDVVGEAANPVQAMEQLQRTGCDRFALAAVGFDAQAHRGVGLAEER